MATISDFLIRVRVEGQQLVDKLISSTNKVEKGMDSASTSTNKFGAAVKNVGKDMAGAVATGNLFADSVLGALKTLGPLAGGVATAAGAFALLGLKAINIADQLGDLSDATGVSAGRLLNFKQSIIEAGGNSETFEKVIAKLNVKLGEAAQGNEKVRKTFKDLGVSLGDANGDIRSTDDLLPEIIAALKQIPDPAIRAATAVEILGKEAAKIDWSKVSAGKDAITDAQVQALAKYRDEIDKLANSIERNLITAFGRLAEEINKNGVLKGLFTGGLVAPAESIGDWITYQAIKMTQGAEAADKFAAAQANMSKEVREFKNLSPQAQQEYLKYLDTLKKGQAPLPPGMKPSEAGAGRGNVNPTGQLKITDQGLQAIANAQAQTKALKETNAEALKYQQQLNDTIGMQQFQGDIERSTLAIEKERATKVAELQKQIETETNNKERDQRVTAAITNELRKQIADTNANAEAMKKAKADEITKLQQQKDLIADIMLLNEHLVNDVQLKQLANQNALIGLYGDELKEKEGLLAIDNQRLSAIETIEGKLRALGKDATKEDIRRAQEQISEANRVAGEK